MADLSDINIEDSPAGIDEKMSRIMFFYDKVMGRPKNTLTGGFLLFEDIEMRDNGFLALISAKD